jgi:hypothetical protein
MGQNSSMAGRGAERMHWFEAGLFSQRVESGCRVCDLARMLPSVTFVITCYGISRIETLSHSGSNGLAQTPFPKELLMENKAALPARVELLNALDEQIHVLVTKTFASFTDDERSEYKTRQQRIRDLEQQLAFAQSEVLYDSGLFAGIYT